MSILSMHKFINMCSKIESFSIILRGNFHTFGNFKNKLFQNHRKVLHDQKVSKSIFSYKKPNAQDLKIRDNIPDEYDLIYRNTMYRYLLFGQIFSGIGAGTVAYVLLKEESNTPIKYRNLNEPKHVENELLIFTTALAGFCVAIQAMIYKLPVRIYHLPQQQKYIFTFYRSIPFLTRRLTCTSKEVTKLNEGGILPWKSSRYQIEDKQNIIMIENYFRRPADLNIMLGYQKHEDELH